MYRLGHLFADAGLFEKAIRCLTQTLTYDPDHPEGRKLLAELYGNLGYEGSSQEVKKEKKEAPSFLRYFPPSISEKDIDLFLHLFAGREVGYAVQNLKSGTGQACWEYIEGVINPELVNRHLKGEITLGGLPLRSDNTVKYAIIQIQPAQHLVFHYLKSPSMLIQLEETAQEQALKMAMRCGQLNVPTYIEATGRRGKRIWFFFTQFFHFLLIKRFVDRLINALPFPDTRLKVEPLLSTQPIGLGWQEQPIMLPLGNDQQSGKRCLFVDNNALPFQEQLKFIRKIREIDEPQIRNIISSVVDMQPAFSQKDKGAPKSLRDFWKQCPVLSVIKDKAQTGRRLNNDEKLIFFYTLGLSAKTQNYLHILLEQCPDYQYKKTERMLAQLKQHPISCLKIRSLIPEITASVRCDCVFDLRGGKYPSPFLHLEPNTHLCVSETLITGAGLKEMVKNYFLLMDKQEELARDLEKLKAAIAQQLKKRAMEKVQVPAGSLLRVVNGEISTLIVERS